jgi:NitT/TauT family transport system permease protein
MRSSKIHYYSHRGRRKHPSSILGRLGTHIVLPLSLVVLATFVATGAFFIPLPSTYAHAIQARLLVGALGTSLLRLLFAYALSLLVSVPLAMLAERNRRIESLLLPVYDVLESIPVLAFFPVVILFFVRSGLLEGAAIFMLFSTMIWNIVFNTIGGLKVIPQEVKSIGFVFGLSSWERFTKITLPALFPSIVTGSILAFAQGWNILIVAEALHVYAPQSAQAHDLFGIGSVLVSAAAQGNTDMLLVSMTLLIIVIAIINLAVWQPLLARAERYKFE